MPEESANSGEQEISVYLSVAHEEWLDSEGHGDNLPEPSDNYSEFLHLRAMYEVLSKFAKSSSSVRHADVPRESLPAAEPTFRLRCPG